MATHLYFPHACRKSWKWKYTSAKEEDEEEEDAEKTDMLLAGRDIGVLAGVATLVATEVGGGFVNGTAEAAFRRTGEEGGGLLWCLAPIGYSLSMALNGFAFAPR